MTTRKTLRNFLCTLLLGISTVACGPDSKDSYSVLADNIPGGVLLSLTSDGDEAIFVGGDLTADGSGKGIIVRYDGETICVEDTQTDHTLWWIHSARPGEWYAVGDAGTIIHEVDGVRTDESVATTSPLYGVWDAGDRVIAVGGNPFTDSEGEIWVRENDVWTQLASGLPGVAFKVWNNWIVGDEIAYHLEGDTLVERFPPQNTLLRTVVGRSDDDVWAVGGGPNGAVVLHWSGSNWEEIVSDPFCARGGSQGLNGAWTAPDESVWIAGFDATMTEFDGTWDCADFNNPPTFQDFHAVAKHGDEILWAGGNMNSPETKFGTIGRYGSNSTLLEVTTCP